MFELFRLIYIEQSSVRGIAQIVSNHFKDDHSGEGYPPPRSYLLTCVLMEDDKPATDEVVMGVNQGTWNRVQLGERIDVLYRPEERSRLLPTSSASPKRPYILLVVGLALIALGALHVLPERHG